MNELEKIFLICCKATGIDVISATKKTRQREIVQCRNIFFYFAKKEGYTLTQIGSIVGLDHATVLHGANKIINYLSIDDKITTHYVDLIYGQLKVLNLKKPEKSTIVNKYAFDLKQMTRFDLMRLSRKIKYELSIK